MPEIPRRSSLVAQVAEILHRDLQRGEWKEFLPGENSLSRQLKVSRPTLRAALEILQRQGLIEATQGRRRRILSKMGREGHTTASKEVGVVTGLPYHSLSSFSLFLISELQDDLGRDGYKLNVYSRPQFGSPRPHRALENVLAQARVGCWLLLGPTPACAEWFAKRNVPAFSQGVCTEGLLPSLDVDLRAAARHAVGVFHRKGHSRLALLMPGVAGGDAEQGFREGMEMARVPSEPIILRRTESVREIQSSLSALFSQPMPPTGMLVTRPKHMLTVMTHLPNHGIQVPRDVSLISMSHFPYLDDLTPSVAYYQFDWQSFARRLCRLMRLMVERGPLPAVRHQVMPQFKDGASLASPP